MNSNSTSTKKSTRLSWGELIIARPWWVIAVVSLVILFLSYGATRLQYDPDNRVFFSADNPHLIKLENMENTYAKTDNVFIALQPDSGSVFSPRILRLIVELTEDSWLIPYSNRVDSLSNFQYTRADADDLVVSDLVNIDERDLTPDYAAEIEAVALGKSFLVNRLVSEDARTTGINISVLKPEDNQNAVYEIDKYTRDLLDRYREQNPDVSFYLTGGVIFDVAFAEIPAGENATLVPLMFALILLIVGVSLRTTWATISVLVLMGLSVGTAMGLAGWGGAVLNAGTTGAPVIIMTLSIAHCVHIISTMRQQLAEGLSHNGAIVESLRINLSPVFITSITTAIGFLTLNFSEAPPFRLLGNIVATGVIASFILAITLLPAILAVVTIKPPESRGVLVHRMEQAGDFVVRYRNALIIFMGCVILLLASGLLRITLDDNFIHYFSDKFEVRRDTDFVENNLTGLNAIEYSLPAGEEGAINDPAYLKGLDDFTEWLRTQPGVTNVGALSQVIKDLNQSMNGDDPAFNRIPESRELAAQYLLLYEMSLPYGLDLNNTIDVGKSQSRVIALLQGASSADLRELNSRAERWLKDNYPALHAPGSGLSMVFAYISERNINSMLFGSLLALVLISFILVFALRSLKFGLISLIPNLVPAGMALGLWGYLSGEVGLSVAIVVAVTLGIVVDDTVHFLSKYLRARRELGLTPEAAVKHTFATVGVALWITSLTLSVGFFVLFLSGFKVNAELGLLSAVTISLALLADFFFLPPVLLKIDRAGHKPMS